MSAGLRGGFWRRRPILTAFPRATALRKVEGRRGEASSEGSAAARSEAAWHMDSDSCHSSSMASILDFSSSGGRGSRGIGSGDGALDADLKSARMGRGGVEETTDETGGGVDLGETERGGR